MTCLSRNLWIKGGERERLMAWNWRISLAIMLLSLGERTCLSNWCIRFIQFWEGNRTSGVNSLAKHPRILSCPRRNKWIPLVTEIIFDLRFRKIFPRLFPLSWFLVIGIKLENIFRTCVGELMNLLGARESSNFWMVDYSELLSESLQARSWDLAWFSVVNGTDKTIIA